MNHPKSKPFEPGLTFFVGTGAAWMRCGGASPYDLPERDSARHFLASLLTAQQ
jgi:hypothetical protein